MGCPSISLQGYLTNYYVTLQDILQLLLETSLSSYNGDYDGDDEEKLSDGQAVCQAIEFLMSGQETTAAALAYVSYQLALNTQVQDHVQEDIDTLFNKRAVSTTHSWFSFSAGYIRHVMWVSLS